MVCSITERLNRCPIKMTQIIILPIDSVCEYVVDYLPKIQRSERNEFIAWLIARVLFKTGQYNAFYLDNPKFIQWRHLVTHNLINEQIRYLDNVIIHSLALPRTIKDQVLRVKVHEPLAFFRYED